MKILFHSLTEKHLPLIVKWLNEPHVKRWYSDSNTTAITLENVKLNLLPRIRGDESVYCYIFIYADQPIGYIQWYDAKVFPREGYELSILDEKLREIRKLAAIDIYIGEISALGKGIGSTAIKNFIYEIIIPAGYYACYVDPDVENTRSIAAFTKAGFNTLGNIATENTTLNPMLFNLKIIK